MTFSYHAIPPRPGRPRADLSPEADSAGQTGQRRFLPREQIEACSGFRAACVLAWRNRAVPGMTETYLAMKCGLIQQHVSEYFHPEERDAKGRKRRELPAHKVGLVQEQLGNYAIAQWMARDMSLRFVEEFFAMEGAR